MRILLCLWLKISAGTVLDNPNCLAPEAAKIIKAVGE